MVVSRSLQQHVVSLVLNSLVDHTEPGFPPLAPRSSRRVRDASLINVHKLEQIRRDFG